jgi:hypothetical protein
LPLVVELHHSDLQELAEKEQDQLVLAVGEWWSRSVDVWHYRTWLTITPCAPQSHYVFMAGITYLYGLWNINMLGDSTVAPSLMEAHLDIQACLSVLEALSGGSRKLDLV